MLEILAPTLFAFLWSTGFPAATLGMIYAEPMTFLAIRMGLVVVILSVVLLVWKKNINTRYKKMDLVHAAWVGVLIHGIYLGGVFAAIKLGFQAGLVAVIASMHPIITTILGHFILREPLKLLQISGLIIGLLGAVIIIIDTSRIDITAIINGNNTMIYGYIFSFSSLIGIVWASLHQKKYALHVPPIPSFLAQYSAAMIYFSIIAFMVEDQVIELSLGFITSMTWLVLCLSIGAIGLWMYLLKKNAIAKVSSLFYLVPALATIEGWLLFNQTFSIISILGIILTIMGIALVTRS